MFGRSKSAQGPIETLIGAATVVEGNLRFKGGLRIDGEVRGSVIAIDGAPSMVVLSARARVVGSVRAASVMVNGTIEGPVQADELIEVQSEARVRGDVRYRTIEIHQGAVIEGTLAQIESERPGLKLAASKE
jgi:cytoskeletal protein CcmA (bactofilin family)